MKKLVALMLIAVLCISFAACGKKPAEETTAAPETTEAAETDDAATDAPGTEAPETEAPTEAPEDKQGLHNGATVLNNDTVIEKEKDYKLDSMFTEIMTDRAIDRGWSYYYVESDEDNIPVSTWSPSDGNFTSVCILAVCKNLSEDPCRFAENSSAKIVFDEGGDEKVFEGQTFQTNPKQDVGDGYGSPRSTVHMDIEKDEKSVFSCLIDVDRDFHDAVVAEGGSTKPIWAYFELSNGDKYCINLREEMVLFGYDDSDDESAITADIHRMMKAATGAEYLEEFLSKSADFADIAKKAGIDIKTCAEKFAPLFTIKVTDIIFDSDTEATAYCTVSGPDFVQMYKELDKLSEKKFADVDKSSLTEEEFYKMSLQMMLDYTEDDFFPCMDRQIEIKYVLEDEDIGWICEDSEAAKGDMRVMLINF